MSKKNYFKERIMLLILLFAFMTPFGALAQTIQLTGLVTDAANEPIIGASVVEKGTTNGVITDFDGNFALSVSPKATIIISYVGYATQEVPVNGKTNIRVTLKEDTEMLDEVVVVGYGVQKKSDLTSSISSVKGKDVRSMNVSNATESLQGKVAGITVVGAGGPGAQPKVLIRGFSTINLTTDPLYVVDGVPMGGGINFLNPNEIESIEVLKDASASAIYGSRASNGVIMVTTRKGKEGKPTFYIDMHYGVQEMKNPYDMADAVEYAEILNTAALNAGYPKEFDDPSVYAGKTTNWWGAGIREYTPQMNASIGVQGGTDKNKYAVSLNYYQQDSFYEKGGYKRFTARLTNDYLSSG